MKPDKLVDAYLDGTIEDIRVVEGLVDDLVDEGLRSFFKKKWTKKGEEANFERAKRKFRAQRGLEDPQKPREINRHTTAGILLRRNQQLKDIMGEAFSKKKVGEATAWMTRAVNARSQKTPGSKFFKKVKQALKDAVPRRKQKAYELTPADYADIERKKQQILSRVAARKSK